MKPGEPICRYAPAALRRKVWESTHGPIPEGQRLAQTCHVAYCGNMEHMVLAPDKNHGKTHWGEVAAKVKRLRVGYSCILPYPTDANSLRNLRSALYMRLPLIKFSTKSLPGKGVRITRVGGYE
jgi:hypothetical protein